MSAAVMGSAAALCMAGISLSPTAHAQDTAAAEQPMVVSLGDSFISGEAGRWAGNSNDTSGDVAGTDRAYDAAKGKAYPRRVYGASYDNGCNRSDSAEVNSAPGGGRRVNLACSGATSEGVLLPENGGVPFKNEPSQAEQLQRTVKGHPVRAVVVSVGGNDLGFEQVIKSCASNFVKPIGATPCAPTQGPEVSGRLPAMRDAAAATLADVTTAMARAGHPKGSYRLILQSYPSPLPDGERIRYPGERYNRATTGGCPFFDKDLTWANEELVPAISADLAKAARAGGAEFLDLSRAFDGREVCSDSTVQAGAGQRPSGTTSEWVRFVTSGLGQGQLQESLHPNFYGQRALGTCLGLQLDKARGNYACTNTEGAGPADMNLRSVSPA